MHEALKTYISELNKCYATGVAREHAYRPALQNLMIELLPKNYTVVNEPARSECGAPDFIILKGDSPLAFIEAKDLQDTDLDGKKSIGNNSSGIVHHLTILFSRTILISICMRTASLWMLFVWQTFGAIKLS